MLKLIVLSYLIEMVLGAAYPDQHCYICEQNACLYPSSQDIKVCSDSGNAGADTSGKNFVNGALNKNDSARIYDSLAAELETFGTATLGLNSNAMPKWPSLTRWVCYVSKDKRRGCLIMGKGLCEEKRSWLSSIGSLGGKISSILAKAKEATSKMFKDNSASTTLNEGQKANISTWFAEHYMSKLVNTSTDPQYQLDTCCEGKSCNDAIPLIRNPTAMLVFPLLLSVAVLV